MEQGQEVGRLAQDLFPGGRVAGNAEATQALIADASVPVIFEAPLVSAPFVAKADMLVRQDDGWHFVEVKSSFSDTDKYDSYLDDLAYTAMVLQRAGITVVKSSLILLSRDYRQGGNVEDLFVTADETQEVLTRAAKFDGDSNALADDLLGDPRPDPVLISACRKCGFFATECLGAGHAHTVLELPRLHHTKLKTLSSGKRISLDDVPEEFQLNDKQRRVIDATREGTQIVGDGLAGSLGAIQWPCYYLDFETVATVLPLYDGHGCHQQVLTQFSVHRRDNIGGDLGHSEFLADASQSRERLLAEALIEALGDNGSVFSYGWFEKTRITALRDAFPDLAVQLEAILGRIVNLNNIIETHVYHPQFRGSFSVKNVLPALVPDMSYKGLAIADGDTAITNFARMARGETTGDDIVTTREHLLAYCKMDTLAMVRLHDALHQLL